ncbi:MAG: tail fiber domain-containing protein [Bacteroidota bacterium]
MIRPLFSVAILTIALLFASSFLKAQNVGIGTNAPLSKLHVAGTIRSDTLVYVGPGVRSLFSTPNGRIYDSLVAPSALNWQIAGNSNITAANFLGTTNANDVIFKTNNLERARILSAGNFGINTATPLERLHVNGNILANDGVYPQSSFNVGYSSATVISDIFQPWTDNGIKIYDGNSLSHLHVEALGHCAIQAYGTGGAPKASLENTGYSALVLQDKGGNVGINTIAPGNKLEITSALANTSGLRFTNLTSASPTVATNGKALSVDVNGDVVLMPSSANAWQLLGNAGTTAGTNFLGTTDAQDLVFKTNNLERVRTLATNGNVGIAHTAPLSKLTVMERFDGNFAALNPFTKLTGISVEDNTDFIGVATEDMDGNLATTNDAASLIYWGDDGNEPLNFKFLQYNGTGFTPKTVATLLPNGNVGISVPAPTKKLEITSNTNAALYATRDFNGVANSDAGFIGGIDASYGNTGVYFVQKDNISLGSYATSLMNVVSNGATKVVVNGTGNMRIGNQFYNSQSGGAATSPDVTNIKLAVMGGYSSFGNYNSDPNIIPAAPDRSWIGGVGALVLGMNRIAGTSNVDFWNNTDPGNGGAALTATDRGFNWRNFNFVAGSSVENSLMTLNGLGNLTISGTNYFTSDKRLKTEVKAFESNILAKIMKLQPSTYQKHSSSIDAGGNIVVNYSDTPISDFGFIAQDVYDVFPELVSKPKNESKELWSVDYARLSVMLTKAVQEQQQVIQSQEERIQKLEKALTELLEKK